jgi:hypothetical protein
MHNNKTSMLPLMVFCLETDTITMSSRTGRTNQKDYTMCCFFAKHASIRSKSKGWLARNQNNMSEWSHMSTRRLVLVCQHYKSSSKRVGLVQRGYHH